MATDNYDANYCDSQKDWNDPKGPFEPFGMHVVRGSSFTDDPMYLRNSSQSWWYLDVAGYRIGFCFVS